MLMAEQSKEQIWNRWYLALVIEGVLIPLLPAPFFYDPADGYITGGDKILCLLFSTDRTVLVNLKSVSIRLGGN